MTKKVTLLPATPKKIAANRANARKSTGPRSEAGKRRAALNALQRGSYGAPMFEAMATVGEDPRQYLALFDGLIRSHRPVNLAQMAVVEDIAKLRWQRRWVERGIWGRVAWAVETLEFERERLRQQFDRDLYNVPQEEVLEKGICQLPDSPAKFEKILSCLDALLQQVEAADFTSPPEGVLTMLYGKKPSVRGGYLINKLRRFTSAAGQSGLPAPPGAQAPSEPERLALLKELLKEKQAVSQEYLLYNRQHVQISPARRSACFAPTGSDWLTTCALVAIDAQIERKTQLLMDMQSRVPVEGEAEAEEPGSDEGWDEGSNEETEAPGGDGGQGEASTQPTTCQGGGGEGGPQNEPIVH